MTVPGKLDLLHAQVHDSVPLIWFTRALRVLLALAFVPSGLTKLLGNRFTLLSPDTPIGMFFEGLYQTGMYWRFIGVAQLAAAALLLFPRTATIGAVVYFPIILNIFLITISLHFRGTPFITGLMLLGCIYLLCWDYGRLRALVSPAQRAGKAARTRYGGPTKASVS